MLKIKAYDKHCIRVYKSMTADVESGLTKYGIIKEPRENITSDLIIKKSRGTDGVPYGFQTKSGQHILDFIFNDQPSGGFKAVFYVPTDSRIYGLGDVDRTRLEKTDYSAEMWVRNVKSYIPVPFLYSPAGWGILLNSTWRLYVEITAGKITFTAKGGCFDVFLFKGRDLPSLLDIYTRVTGRPSMLPKFGYGLTFVANQKNDASATLNDCLNFRREGIPCDVVGLEPGWGTVRYDFSTLKAWNPDKYYIPDWQKDDRESTFIGAMDRLNFQLSLWLCIEYDLSYEEERSIGHNPDKGGQFISDDDCVHDTHFISASRLDQNTKIDEPFFEHLKKFVNQGVRCFKLDGCHQIDDHPDRRWGNGMSDEEMHNLFPIIYSKQMSKGFETHTARRSMIYTSGGGTGMQQYSATWAGDTGGGAKPLVSLLNLGMVGYSNTTCDMDTSSAEGIHFGFMQTWSQLSNWAYWKQPWFLTDELKTVFRRYALLRYRLLPYFYSAARTAFDTGMPVMRPMQLVYPETDDSFIHQYMLGDSILTSCYTNIIHLPAGHDWTDARTGTKYHGGRTVTPENIEGFGGPIFVRDGSAILTLPQRQFIGQRVFDHVILNVYPHSDDGISHALFYDDDGDSLDYRSEGYASADLSLERKGKEVTVNIPRRAGSFNGMPDTVSYDIRIYGCKASSFRLNGKPVSAEITEEGWCVPVSDGIFSLSVINSGVLSFAVS